MEFEFDYKRSAVVVLFAAPVPGERASWRPVRTMLDARRNFDLIGTVLGFEGNPAAAG
jgi:hypothetical protein